MVCSHTVTDHRAAISSQRSIRRQPGDLDGLAHDRTSCASCQGSHRIEQPAIREGAEKSGITGAGIRSLSLTKNWQRCKEKTHLHQVQSTNALMR